MVSGLSNSRDRNIIKQSIEMEIYGVLITYTSAATEIYSGTTQITPLYIGVWLVTTMVSNQTGKIIDTTIREHGKKTPYNSRKFACGKSIIKNIVQY